MATGLIDGFFIDITPQVLPNVSDPTDPVDAPIPYANNVAQLCEYCSAERRAALLEGLGLALQELAAACPKAVIICNPTDYGACNTQFFEYFGSSADHGRTVLGDFHILQNKYPQRRHLVQARAASEPPSFLFHIAEFLISVGEYTYLGLSHGWGCDDGWFEEGVPGDPHIWSRPLGKPLGPFSRTPSGAVPAPAPHGTQHNTGGWVYTRSFGNGTHVWLNLTDGSLWKHARACTRPNAPWPAKPTCPQACIWWSDGAVSVWPPGFTCHRGQLLGH